MRVKSFLAALVILLGVNVAFAQDDKSYKMISLAIEKELVFDKLIDFLQEEELFILSVDKQAGFIQAKVFVEDKSFFSSKNGVRRTMNFIIRPKGEQTNVTLNIYVEEQRFKASSYYYEDQGISKDVAVYKDILGKLQLSMEQ